MNSFNFDEYYFRRVIAKSPLVEPVPPVKQLLSEASFKFFEEFDYCPNVAVCAPGSFTILGEYMEIADGYMMQAALPQLIVITARFNNYFRGRVTTLTNEIDNNLLKKVTFPMIPCRTLKKGIPRWSDVLKGLANVFLRKNKLGVDAVIHSSLPMSQGFGSSAALQAAFYLLLELMVNKKIGKNLLEKAKRCKAVEEAFGETFKGFFNNYTAFFAKTREAVVINTGTGKVERLEFRDPNILFLLTIPKKNVLLHNEDLIRIRKTELMLVARILNLKSLRDAKACHLEILAKMPEPSREAIKRILREFEKDEEFIAEFLDELFNLPEEESSVEGESAPFSGEGLYYEQMEAGEADFTVESDAELPYRYNVICDQTACLGGLSDLSARSDLTVMSKLVRRLRYVVTENARILAVMDFITKLDYVSAGLEVTRSHLSLKVDFEMSCSFLDRMMKFSVESDEGVYGSKMMRNGGLLSLVHRNSAEGLIENIKKEFGEDFKFYFVFPGRGASELKMTEQKIPLECSFCDEYTTTEEMMKNAVANFDATYQRMPTHGAYSPGVLPVLGDQSSYNEGFSLPKAFSLGVVAVGALNGSGKIRVVSTWPPVKDKNRTIFPLPSIQPIKTGKVKWANYVKGIVQNFKGTVPGFDCLVESNIPVQCRISSSTALQVAVYTFLEELTGQRTENPVEKAGRCMKSEQEYQNVLCGIDVFLCAIKSVENMDIFIDCKKCIWRYIPTIDLSDVAVLIWADTNCSVKKGSLYFRLEECFDVASFLGLPSLRCATEEELKDLQDAPAKAVERARHVVQENQRVFAAIEALRKNDMEKFGRILVESHRSLRDKFEVSCPALDQIVECSMQVDGVMGARMTGSEYGTSVICMLKRWAVNDLVDYLKYSLDYEFRFFLWKVAGGACPLDIKGYVDSLPGPKHNFERIFVM